MKTYQKFLPNAGFFGGGLGFCFLFFVGFFFFCFLGLELQHMEVPKLGVIAASLDHSHSNTGSELHL